jgi:hypothetical protein
MGRNSAQRPTHNDVQPILWLRHSGARGPLVEPAHVLRGLPAGTERGARARTEAFTTLRAHVAAWPAAALPWLSGALEHPRWRGHLPDKWVKAAAHPSFLPTGRGEKTGTAVAFSNEVGAPVAGVVLHQGGKEEGVRHSYTRGKRQQGGCSGLRRRRSKLWR